MKYDVRVFPEKFANGLFQDRLHFGGHILPVLVEELVHGAAQLLIAVKQAA